jgi:hypothetical protein
MGNGGLSKERIDRMHYIMSGYVERGEMPGIVTLVSRRGEVAMRYLRFPVDLAGMVAWGHRVIRTLGKNLSAFL